MADLMNGHQSRRKFISLGLLNGVGIVTGSTSAQSPYGSGESVKMLTKEGRLVEVDKARLSPQSLKKQASKRDVLSWIHPEKER